MISETTDSFRRHLRDAPVAVRSLARQWRAVCVVEEDTAVWFWIGSHAAHDASRDALQRA